MKVRNLLIVLTGVFLVVSMSIFCVFVGTQLETSAQSMYEDYLRDFSGTEAVSLENYLSGLVAKLRTISEFPAVNSYTSGTSSASGEAQELLDSLVASSGVTSAIIYDDSYNILLGAGVRENETKADGVCVTDAADEVPVINASASQGNTQRYFISVKKKVNNYNVGLLFEQLKDQNANGMREILTRTGVMFAVDPRNVVLAGGSLAYNNINDATDQFSQYKDAIANATTSPALFRSSENVAYVTATPSGWVVVANNTVSSASSYSSPSTSGIVGVSVAMFFVFFIVAIVAIITVTKPLSKIGETIEKINHGDHDARVDIMSKNEYGDIARVFNDIADDIIVSESRYRTIIEMSDNIIFEWNFINNEVIFSNNFNKKFSYRAPSDHFADSFLLKCKVHPEDSDRYKSDLEKLAKGENFKHNEYRWKNIYGDYIWVLIRTATICDKEGNPVKTVGVIVDIDRAKKSENMLTARASFDALTGVYNRETIESAVNNEIELIGARKNEFAILFLDIDDFKFFNDHYSHATGDQVLRFTATSIRNALGDNGMAGRYGGDEFILCLRNSDMNDPAALAEQLLNTLRDGFDSDTGDHFSVNVSIGISIIRDDSKRVEEIIGMADDAMYKIKKNGKSNFGFLSEEDMQ